MNEITFPAQKAALKSPEYIFGSALRRSYMSGIDDRFQNSDGTIKGSKIKFKDAAAVYDWMQKINLKEQSKADLAEAARVVANYNEMVIFDEFGQALHGRQGLLAKLYEAAKLSDAYITSIGEKATKVIDSFDKKYDMKTLEKIWLSRSTTNDKKVEILKNFHKMIAEEYGLSPVEIENKDLGENRGWYKGGKIEINLKHDKHKDFYQAALLILHETIHAVHAAMSENKDSKIYEDKYHDDMSIIWVNFNLGAIGSGYGYNESPLEYAAQKVEKIFRERFGLQSREEELNKK
ncbi:MAG: hypothetical protein V4691_06195 [Pseudomonadota bacterium]